MAAALAQKGGKANIVKNAFVLIICSVKIVNWLVNVTKTQQKAVTHTRANAIVKLAGAQICAIGRAHS